jgi:hypothetical protein
MACADSAFNEPPVWGGGVGINWLLGNIAENTGRLAPIPLLMNDQFGAEGWELTSCLER